MNREKLNLSAPWCTYYREINELFGNDPEIKIEFDEEEPEIKMYVRNHEKADALTRLLPVTKAFGWVELKITVIPANELGQNKAKLFESAFKGNPAFSYMATVDGIMTNPMTFIVFQNKVVQYWNDDLGDINGNCSTLYQTVAKDVFGDVEGIFFCTDTPKEA